MMTHTLHQNNYARNLAMRVYLIQGMVSFRNALEVIRNMASPEVKNYDECRLAAMVVQASGNP